MVNGSTTWLAGDGIGPAELGAAATELDAAAGFGPPAWLHALSTTTLSPTRPTIPRLRRVHRRVRAVSVTISLPLHWGWWGLLTPAPASSTRPPSHMLSWSAPAGHAFAHRLLQRPGVALGSFAVAVRVHRVLPRCTAHLAIAAAGDAIRHALAHAVHRQHAPNPRGVPTVRWCLIGRRIRWPRTQAEWSVRRRQP